MLNMCLYQTPGIHAIPIFLLATPQRNTWLIWIAVSFFCKTKHFPSEWKKCFNRFVMGGRQMKQQSMHLCVLSSAHWLPKRFLADYTSPPEDFHAKSCNGDRSVKIDTMAKDGTHIGHLFVCCKRWKSNNYWQ